MWIGRVYQCVYGLNQGDTFKVTTEPYSIDRRGTKVVSGVSSNNEEMQIECEELVNSIYWRRQKNNRKGCKA